MKSSSALSDCASQQLYLHEHPAHPLPQGAIYRRQRDLARRPCQALAVVRWDPQRQLFGMAEEALPPQTGWYMDGRAGGLPFWGRAGLNARVLAVNAGALRSSNFTTAREQVLDLWGRQRKLLPLGAQDVLNVYLSQQAGAVAVMPCGFNYCDDCGCQLDQQPVAKRGTMMQPLPAATRADMRSAASSAIQTTAQLNQPTPPALVTRGTDMRLAASSGVQQTAKTTQVTPPATLADIRSAAGSGVQQHSLKDFTSGAEGTAAFRAGGQTTTGDVIKSLGLSSSGHPSRFKGWQ